MLKEVCRPEKSILTLNGIGVCFRFDVSKLFPRTNRDESTFMEKKGRLMARDSSSSLFSKREREFLESCFSIFSSPGGDLPCSTLDLLRRIQRRREFRR